MTGLRGDRRFSEGKAEEDGGEDLSSLALASLMGSYFGKAAEPAPPAPPAAPAISETNNAATIDAAASPKALPPPMHPRTTMFMNVEAEDTIEAAAEDDVEAEDTIVLRDIHKKLGKPSLFWTTGDN